ncbi:unnamed protein product [Linum trigynum]|uniref:Uncharacterized protein n=1 Tax=Linum trigynum TaxID=586398 RepID=A0AAV2DWN5_9ROSI
MLSSPARERRRGGYVWKISLDLEEETGEDDNSGLMLTRAAADEDGVDSGLRLLRWSREEAVSSSLGETVAASTATGKSGGVSD